MNGEGRRRSTATADVGSSGRGAEPETERAASGAAAGKQARQGERLWYVGASSRLDEAGPRLPQEGVAAATSAGRDC